MKATPEDIARLEKLALERGGTVSHSKAPGVDSPGVAPEKVSEAEFIEMVLALAKRNGWRTAHFRPGMTRCKRCGGFGFVGQKAETKCPGCKGSGRNWATAVQGDGKGFPDLCLVRERVVWAELKAEGGKMTMEQLEWLAALQGAGQNAELVAAARAVLNPLNQAAEELRSGYFAGVHDKLEREIAKAESMKQEVYTWRPSDWAEIEKVLR